MPAFDNIGVVYAPGRPLTRAEILRSLQFGIASEYETIQIYQQIMESTNNPAVHTILTDITGDEMRHAGALQQLLYLLGPRDAAQYQRGAQKAVQDLGGMGVDFS